MTPDYLISFSDKFTFNSMFRQHTFFLFLVVFIGGCAPKQLLISSSGDLTDHKQIDFPSLNTSTTNVLGDTLASKGVVTSAQAVKFLEEVTFQERNGDSPRHWVPKGSKGKFTHLHTVIHTGEKISCLDIRVDWDEHWNWFNLPGTGTRQLCKGASGEYKWLWEYTIGQSNYLEIYKRSHIPFTALGKIEETSETSLNSPTFVQQFIYNGRVGNALKFIYREFSGDYIKPAFTQEVQYDLDQSNTIGFKNLKMTILNASNTEITYILHSNF